ncbi:MAG: macro domain-containing protein [Alphaproteobacteria bacterium]|nr:macro domain-containing protein [Alphaproteobacteria bacterium]
MDSFISEPISPSNPYLNRIKVVQGDITRQNTDAIVTVIPQTLEYRGMLNAAILEGAGTQLDKFILEHIVMPRTGDVYAVPGFNLPCKHIIYCIVPIWKDDFDRHDRDLTKACRKAVELARSMRLRSLAFPPIGSGQRGFPKARAARLIVEVIASRLSADIDEIRIVCRTKTTMQHFKDRLFLA